MNEKEKLEKAIESLIDQMFEKADPKMKHLSPGENVMDGLIGPAKDLDGKPQMGTDGEEPPTSPDYGEQPGDMREEQGRSLKEPREREDAQKAPTSPDYGLQPSDKLKKDEKKPKYLDQPAPTSPDLGLQPEKTYEEKAGDRGRPMEVHDVPNIDDERPSGKGYEVVQHETARISKEYHAADPNPNPEWEEMDKERSKMKKSDEYRISRADYMLLQEAKKAREQEQIRKSQSVQSDLIKSIVAKEVGSLRAENEELKKHVRETNELLKSWSRRPQDRKSIANVSALEKSFVNADEVEGSKPFTKKEMLDAAETLVKSQKLPLEAVIELEESGTLLNPYYRTAIEGELRKSQK